MKCPSSVSNRRSGWQPTHATQIRSVIITNAPKGFPQLCVNRLAVVIARECMRLVWLDCGSKFFFTFLLVSGEMRSWKSFPLPLATNVPLLIGLVHGRKKPPLHNG